MAITLLLLIISSLNKGLANANYANGQVGSFHYGRKLFIGHLEGVKARNNHFFPDFDWIFT